MTIKANEIVAAAVPTANRKMCPEKEGHFSMQVYQSIIESQGHVAAEQQEKVGKNFANIVS